MTSLALEILRLVYNRSDHGALIDLAEIEVFTGKSPSELRPALEDLKQERYIIENMAKFELSTSGMYFCKSQWV